jgi:hypothetical protein
MLTGYSESPKALTISVSGDVVGGRAWGAVERADVSFNQNLSSDSTVGV